MGTMPQDGRTLSVYLSQRNPFVDINPWPGARLIVELGLKLLDKANGGS